MVVLPLDQAMQSDLYFQCYCTTLIVDSYQPSDAPTVTLEQNPAHNLYSDESVSFNCHINVSSGWTYQFVLPDGRVLDYSGSKHNITSVTTRDSGSYNCKVKRGKVFDSDNKVKLNVEGTFLNFLLSFFWF